MLYQDFICKIFAGILITADIAVLPRVEGWDCVPCITLVSPRSAHDPQGHTQHTERRRGIKIFTARGACVRIPVADTDSGLTGAKYNTQSL